MDHCRAGARPVNQKQLTGRIAVRAGLGRFKSYLDTRTDAITILSPVKHPGPIVSSDTEYANAASKRLLAVIRPGVVRTPDLAVHEPTGAARPLHRGVRDRRSGRNRTSKHRRQGCWFRATVESRSASVLISESERTQHRVRSTPCGGAPEGRNYRSRFSLAAGLADRPDDAGDTRATAIGEITGFTENELPNASDITVPTSARGTQAHAAFRFGQARVCQSETHRP